MSAENWVGEKKQQGNKCILKDKIAWQEETLDGLLSLFLSHRRNLDLRAFGR